MPWDSTFAIRLFRSHFGSSRFLLKTYPVLWSLCSRSRRLGQPFSSRRDRTGRPPPRPSVGCWPLDWGTRLKESSDLKGLSLAMPLMQEESALQRMMAGQLSPI